MGRVRLAIAVTGALLASVAVTGCFVPTNTDQGAIDVHGDPNPADVGEEVVFDARSGSSSSYSGHKFDWDLNGDGAFETPGGAQISRTFAAPGIYPVGVDVGRPAFGPSAGGVVLLVFLHEYDNTTVQVSPPPSPGNQPPMAAFAHDADPGYAETPVRFDASGSTDPEGQIVSYEWDFGDTHSDDDRLTTKSRQ